MKHLKIKLSVLALACLGAGALALQPTANVKAEATPADCLTMVHGAAVYVSPEGAEKDFNGIRWTTKIDATKYTEGEFGTLVLPTSMLGDDGVLTHDDEDVLDLPANVDYANLPEVFYSIVSYDALGANASAAYALELTARSYVKIGDDYYYASLEDVNTSRSARQVALSTELAGEFEDDYKADKAAKYYGMDTAYEVAEEDKNTGAAGTEYIDLEALATNAQEVTLNKVEIEGNVDTVFVGAERVEFMSYDSEGKKFNFKVEAGQQIPTGETYVTILTDSGIYSEHIIGATKVFRTFKDFEVFDAIRNNLRENTNGQKKISAKVDSEEDLAKYTFDGYYVLGDSLAWDATTDVAKADAEGYEGEGWYGAGDFADTKLGLSGTFNGLGNTIKGYQDNRLYTGIFQLVNGGTIKNTYFYNYTPTNSRAQILAHYVIDPKIENVFIYSKEKMQPTKNHYILGAYLYQSEKDAAKLSNVLVRIIYADVDGSTKARTGGLFGEYNGQTQSNYNWNNVYVATNVGISSKGATKSYVMIGTSQKYIHIPKFAAVAENQKTENGYTFTEWRYKGSVALTLTDDGNMTATFTYKGVDYSVYTTADDPTTTTFDANIIKHDEKKVLCLNGVYCYYDIDAFNAAKENHNGYENFLNSNGANCWELNADGNLAWG